MALSLLSLLLPLTAMAEAPTLSSSERNSIYEENGMTYAKSLHQKLDGSPEDELSSQKTEALNYKIRERGIKKLEAHLAKEKNPSIRKDILFRLAQLEEQQSEIVSRRGDLKDKKELYEAALRKSNKALEALRREFPKFSPDATVFSLAENYSKLKEDKKAEQYYREVIQNYPHSKVVADALLSMGNLYFERHAFFAARNFYGKILSTEEVKLHPYAHYKIAWCYFNESDFPSALAGLEKAIGESRKLQQNGDKKLGVEEEALSDLVLFFAEYGNPSEAKDYFEKLVTKEKANELRYNLSKRLFEYGKHLAARDVAKQLLDEKPQKEFVNKLYLILISSAEKTKDRDFGLKTAQKLSSWIKDENLKSDDTNRIETEEYMRQYSQKLHYEAETLKQKEVWEQAKNSYEIYLKTFPNEAETPEVKFRFAVLLLNRKDQLRAYQNVSEALVKMDEKHPRFKEALKVKIQSIELATPTERKAIDDKDLLSAYDTYAKHFPTEELGIEAQFKAANLAKNLESPEQTAARFKAVATAHPEHNLAKASISEALAVLVKAEKWEALGNESKAIETGALLEKDGDLRKKVSEARELSLVKITEGLEAAGKYPEAKAQYEKILSESPSESMGIYSLVRLSSLSEQKMNSPREAIKYFSLLREKYPAAKEARPALLELARLFDKVNEPRESVKMYKDFASGKTGKLELQALTNAAVLLENLGEREQAASTFFELSKAQTQAKLPKDAAQTYEAGCNNILLSSHTNREKFVLKQIHECSRELSMGGSNALLWQARAAWALDQMADGNQADERWKKIAGKSIKASAEADRAYIAMAKLKLLEGELESFKTLKFSKTNEKPEANIGKKTKALEAFEKSAEVVIKIGSEKQILAAKNLVRQAYLDFAETMEQSALPKALSEADKEELRKTFLAFAQDFKNKAAALEVKDTVRAPASVNPEMQMASLSSEESSLLENGQIPTEKSGELYAKKAVALFKSGKYGEARYFGEKWKKNLAASDPAYGSSQFDLFQSLLSEKLPSTDPVAANF